jgi:DNA-binding transcriptional LysR family regulator
MIELRHLRHLVAIVETGGIRPAARVVHVSPSSVQRSVKALEDRFGVTLFERRGRSLRLTPHGARALEEARSVLAAFDGLGARIEDLDGLETGSLRVGVGVPVTQRLLPRLGKRLLRDLPSVELSTRISDVTRLLPDLLGGKLDVVIAAEAPLLLQRDLEVVPVYRDEATWFVREGHPLLAKRRPALADFAGFPLITQHLPHYFEESVDDIRRAAARKGGRTVRAHRVDDYHLLEEMAAGSDAILLAPLGNVLDGPFGTSLRRVRFPAALPELAFAAALPRSPSPTPLARRFVAIAREEGSALRKEPRRGKKGQP